MSRESYTRRDFIRLSALGASAMALSSIHQPSPNPSPKELDAGIKSFIKAQMAAAHIPGLQVGVVVHDQLVRSNAFGKMNLANNAPVTANTVFMLASISKTVAAVALMQLYDGGRFALDDDINNYLPFPIRNPNYPDSAITFRHVLTHTSSIQDNWDVLGQDYTVGDARLSLYGFLKRYLKLNARDYDPNNNFHTYPPGGAYDYSNVGGALVGYLAESISGTPFDEYCNQNIFAPLNMPTTRWRLSELDPLQVAMPYLYDGATNSFKEVGQFGYPYYPAGILRSNMTELANFLIMFMNNGKYNNTRVLKAATAIEMRRVQYPAVRDAQGLIWYYAVHNGVTYLGHVGGDQGVATRMFYRPSDQVGVLLAANSKGMTEAALFNIEQKLFATYTG